MPATSHTLLALWKKQPVACCGQCRDEDKIYIYTHTLHIHDLVNGKPGKQQSQNFHGLRAQVVVELELLEHRQKVCLWNLLSLRLMPC